MDVGTAGVDRPPAGNYPTTSTPLTNAPAGKSKVRWVDPPKLGMLGQSYLMIFIKGLTTAMRHLFFHKKTTLQSPDERHKIVDPVNYRGVHRLNKDEQGRVKCVACFLCATACPAHCIDIVAEPSPWPDREKYPKVFNIDELRCIYCGMCEQACPVEAIELTSFYDLTGASREEMVFDKEKLLSVFDQTKGLEPIPSKRASVGVPASAGSAKVLPPEGGTTNTAVQGGHA